jgi:protein subunit release factor A
MFDLGKDFEVIITKGSGPGGQHRNKVESCVIIKHILTGLQEKCEDTRSKFKNFEIAKERLLNKINDLKKREKQIKQNEERLDKIKNPEKVRTYNEKRNEVIDHLTGKKANYDEIVYKGKLDLLK